MFQPLECFIGLRYARSRRRRGVVSFMTGASLLGIALGVAALIVILSVMNGLESEARVRLLSLSAHATLSGTDRGLTDWQALRARVAEQPGVIGVSPFVSIEGMLSAGSTLIPVGVQGITVDQEPGSTDIAALMESGSIESLAATERTIVVGRALALNLGVGVGDRLNLLFARIRDGRPRPSLVPFTVGGVFSAGIAQHDSNLALIHIAHASRIREFDDRPEGLSITIEEPLEVASFRAAVNADDVLGALEYSDWTVEHRNHFRAIQIEKMMMSIILMLIVAVAAFNIVASLMMVVTDKRKDIAILRTCGLEPRRVARIFLFQGSIIGFAGTVIGAALGLLLAANVETIVPWLERTLSFKIMPGDVYYVTEIPSEIHALDIVGICVFAFVIAVVATFYPSRRAASITPAEALRYE